MGNSPSRSNNTNFSVPNSSTNQQNLTSSDELNANEPTDPDDSRLLPTIHNNEHSTTKNIDITMKAMTTTNRLREVKGGPKKLCSPMENTTASAESDMTMVQSPPLARKNGKSSFDFDVDISTAKAFGSTNVVSYSGSDSSYSSTDSAASSGHTFFSPSPSTTTTSTNAHNITSSFGSDGAAGYLKPTARSPQSNLRKQIMHKGVENNSLVKTGASIPNFRDSKKRVFLKRHSHDASSNEGLDIDDAIEKLLKIGETRYYKSRDFPFSSWEIQLICYHAREIFLNQPSLLRLQAPIKVVGDIHGQFSDLLRILKLSGVPAETNYLFLGDYVDRGKQSLETILLLFCYKIKYRDNFFMLRGNHESANVTKMYGFFDECKRRTSSKTWKMFIDVFNTLPFAAIIQDRIFCVHGGISPELKSLRQIENIVRPTDIPDEGLITDILWSDPDSTVSDWSLNDRGVSYTFGKKNVIDFCTQFKFDLVIRGHMVVEDGYEFFAKKKFVTIFSAPNYCGEFNNWGAVMSVTTGLMCSFELLKPHTANTSNGGKKKTSSSTHTKSKTKAIKN
ncbi:hypothetical protein HG537_0C03930 [Torulaspora globosa]|uniref:Serine/threonine-protein phosphatase n=1 Tax=Torulaspora globosa TaxID=48254 RepID=A0A7H9HPM0_9SACH|nr:hypothetical protein HG537_0C03930 [Torulaspora sp. CBS 2947]